MQERREFQRLGLNPPLSGTLVATDVRIVEIGILGARVQHAAPFPVDRGELRFDYNGELLSMRCEVVRSVGNESGIRFTAAVGESGDRLRHMLAELVHFELERRRNDTVVSKPPQL